MPSESELQFLQKRGRNERRAYLVIIRKTGDIAAAWRSATAARGRPATGVEQRTAYHRSRQRAAFLPE
jgi:hypothetical protein